MRYGVVLFVVTLGTAVGSIHLQERVGNRLLHAEPLPGFARNVMPIPEEVRDAVPVGGTLTWGVTAHAAGPAVHVRGQAMWRTLLVATQRLDDNLSAARVAMTSVRTDYSPTEDGDVR